MPSRSLRELAETTKFWLLILAIVVGMIFLIALPHIVTKAFGEITITGIDGISPARAGKMLSLGDEITKVFGLPRPIVLTDIDTAEDGRGEGPSPSFGRPPVAPTDADGITLTQEEYEQFKELVKIGRATPRQVGLVTAASVGLVILMAGAAYILLMVILRYTFNRWFDEDIYTQTWPSVIVISIMIIGAVWVLVAAVSR